MGIVGNEGVIPPERIRYLNAGSAKGREYVLYWMQASVRTEGNLALQYAIDTADRLGLPVVAGFFLQEDFPEANLRSFTFLVEGLINAREKLTALGIPLFIQKGNPVEGILQLNRNAACLVLDRGYLRIQRDWYRKIAESAQCPVIQVEDNVVVPVAVASDKEEYSAATIRPKIQKQMGGYLMGTSLHAPKKEFRGDFAGDLSGMPVGQILDTLQIDRSIPPSPVFRGGSDEANRRLENFLQKGLNQYGENRNDPGEGICSGLSPYLHFGQISPGEIARRVKATNSPGAEEFLEELVVRRELAVNFVQFNPRYDSFDCLPNWAKATLEVHSGDSRQYEYSSDELDRGETHDPYWNAAQKEMVATGKMQGYMRMYWGKKILEWSKTPREAYRTALYLNNRYELDGRDPNAYAGIAWCFGKHDRPWKERPIFGMVRYMNAAGLERKFRMEKYLEKTG